MKPSRKTDARPASVALPAERPLFDWNGFWFAAVDPVALHVVRVATGLLLLYWLLPLCADVQPLFSLDGYFDRTAYQQANRLEGGPPRAISWSLTYLVGHSPGGLLALYWASIVVLVLFTLGLFTRLTAPLTWAVVASFTAVPLFDNEADALLLLLTLYLAVGYVLLGLGDAALSWPELLFGSWRTSVFARLLSGRGRPAAFSPAANVALRLVQVHFAIALLASAMHKLQLADWWMGLAHWYVLNPPGEVNPEALRKRISNPGNYVLWLNLMAYATLAWQFGFPFFAWRRGLWRIVLVGGALVGWAGLALMYRLPLFGPALLVGCLAFVSPEEWRALGRLFGMALPARPNDADGDDAAPPSRPPSRELVTTKER